MTPMHGVLTVFTFADGATSSQSQCLHHPHASSKEKNKSKIRNTIMHIFYVQVPLFHVIGTSDTVGKNHVGQQYRVGEAVLSVEYRSDRLAQTVDSPEAYGAIVI